MISGPDGHVAAGRRSVAERGARWFRTCYGHRPQGVWLAPGRVNIIGEHTDYNDGFVLPFALGEGIVAAASPRRDDVLALRTRRDPSASVEIPLARLRPGPDGTPAKLDEIREQLPGWARYPAGVAWSLLAAGYPVPAASLAIDSCLADGAGLSSSAALECSVALALTELVGPDSLGDWAPRDWASGGADGAPRPGRTCRGPRWPASRAGPRTSSPGCRPGSWTSPRRCCAGPGTPCCWTASRWSRARCRSGRAGPGCGCWSSTPGPSTSWPTASTAAGRPSAPKRPGGSGSRRCARCTTSASWTRWTTRCCSRRARHVVTDNLRVRQVTSLLRASGGGDFRSLSEVGALLSQSHASLRDDFEVSWPEADVTVEVAVDAGALGARMTGGGFGGSALALIPEADVDQVAERVRAAFAERGWTEPEFLSAFPSDAAQRMI